MRNQPFNLGFQISLRILQIPNLSYVKKRVEGKIYVFQNIPWHVINLLESITMTNLSPWLYVRRWWPDHTVIQREILKHVSEARTPSRAIVRICIIILTLRYMINLPLTMYWVRVIKYVILTTLQEVSPRKLARNSRWEAQGKPIREGQEVRELIELSYVDSPHWLWNHRNHRIEGCLLDCLPSVLRRTRKEVLLPSSWDVV